MNNRGLIIGAIVFATKIRYLWTGGRRGIRRAAASGISYPRYAMYSRNFVFYGYNTPGVREVLLLMGPRVVGQACPNQFSGECCAGVGHGPWQLHRPDGCLWANVYGVGRAGQSIGTAVFPTLSMLAAEGIRVATVTRWRERYAIVLSYPSLPRWA